MAKVTFVIGRAACGVFILCLRCNRRSFNVNDIANAYCGFCHEYHELPIDEVLGRLEATS
jgi:ribosomal protein L37E